MIRENYSSVEDHFQRSQLLCVYSQEVCEATLAGGMENTMSWLSGDAPTAQCSLAPLSLCPQPCAGDLSTRGSCSSPVPGGLCWPGLPGVPGSSCWGLCLFGGSVWGLSLGDLYLGDPCLRGAVFGELGLEGGCVCLGLCLFGGLCLRMLCLFGKALLWRAVFGGVVFGSAVFGNVSEAAVGGLCLFEGAVFVWGLWLFEGFVYLGTVSLGTVFGDCVCLGAVFEGCVCLEAVFIWGLCLFGYSV